MIASWFRETSEPRISAGAVSEMYRGPTKEATPMARPTTTRAPMSHPTLGANAMPRAPRKKTAAVTRMSLRRPRRSARFPPTIATTTAPTSTPLTTSSCWREESVKSRLTNSSAPEITPVS